MFTPATPPPPQRGPRWTGTAKTPVGTASWCKQAMAGRPGRMKKSGVYGKEAAAEGCVLLFAELVKWFWMVSVCAGSR